MKARGLFAISLLTVMVFGVGSLSDETATGVHVGEVAPDFNLPLLGDNSEQDEDPEIVNLHEQIEQYDVTVLYFFYEYACPACATEWLPEIQKQLDERYLDQNVQAFAIGTGLPAWYLRDLKESLDITFPWLLCDFRLPDPYFSQLFATWELSEEASTLVIIDSEGIIRFRGQGYDEEIDYVAAFDLIGELLSEANPAE